MAFAPVAERATPELKLRETEVADFETPRPFGPVVRDEGDAIDEKALEALIRAAVARNAAG